MGRHEINSCKYMCIYLELFWLCFYNVFEVVIYLSPLFIYRRFFYNFFFILTFVRLRLTFYLYKNISTVQTITNLKIIDFISFKPFETPLCYELWAYSKGLKFVKKKSLIEFLEKPTTSKINICHFLGIFTKISLYNILSHRIWHCNPY